MDQLCTPPRPLGRRGLCAETLAWLLHPQQRLIRTAPRQSEAPPQQELCTARPEARYTTPL